MPTAATRPVPDGLSTVTTHLWFNGRAQEAIEFYQRAFGAELVGKPVQGAEGQGVMHAKVKIGDSHVMLADAWPGSFEQGPTDRATAGLVVYVDDCDAAYKRAIEAGCEVVHEMMDTFWGDRMGNLKDPFGHGWAIASQKWAMTDDEIEEGKRQWLASLRP